MISTLVVALLRLVGAAAVVWAAAMLPMFSANFLLDGAARDLVRGKSYSPAGIARLRDRLEAHPPADRCWVGYLHNRLIIDLADASDVWSLAGSEGIDERLLRLETDATQLLRCSPRAAIGWIVLYWVEIQRTGLSGHAADFLRNSYRFAPREAWISVRRSGLVMPVLHFLPEDLKSHAMVEFKDLVGARLYDQAAQILRRTDRGQYSEILSVLRGLPELTRAAFRLALDAGDDTSISGMLDLPVRASRPWH